MQADIPEVSSLEEVGGWERNYIIDKLTFSNFALEATLHVSLEYMLKCCRIQKVTELRPT